MHCAMGEKPDQRLHYNHMYNHVVIAWHSGQGKAIGTKANQSSSGAEVKRTDYRGTQGDPGLGCSIS